ncbi:MAG TPA: hypothetical protein VMT03_07865 [Polyangia bacterium]|nr:hypothetical protein [Polyangia bacterium]
MGSARRARTFVRTTLIGGVVLLAPLIVLVVLAVKAGRFLEKLAAPLLQAIPTGTLAGRLVLDAIVAVGLLLGCFLAGLLARFSVANRLVAKAEANVLWRIPGYGMIKGLTSSLDPRAMPELRPVLVHFDDYSQVAFEVDRTADGRRVIYLPSAPEPRTGSVIVVDPHRVEPLPLSFVATVTAIRSVGHGVGRSLPARRP